MNTRVNFALRKLLLTVADDLTELVTQELGLSQPVGLPAEQQDLLAHGAEDEKLVRPSSESSG